MTKFNFDFYKNRKIYFVISMALIVAMIVGAIVFGVNLDIQFKGGAIITYSYEGSIDKSQFQATVEEVLGQQVSIQETTNIGTGNQSFVISLPTSSGLNADKQAELAEAVTSQYAENNISTFSISVVNPTIGKEFFAKSLTAVAFACLLMVLYISWRFKKISGWSAGVTAVIALVHDLIMVFAVFVLFQIPLNINFIAVCLTVLGYSLSDTIVIYDRIRENKRIHGETMSLESMVNLSLNQTMVRSIVTSTTTVSAMIVVSIVANIYNVTSIISFSFPMIIGMISGCYSSVCVAPMLWTLWQKNKSK